VESEALAVPLQTGYRPVLIPPARAWLTLQTHGHDWNFGDL